MTKVKQRSFTLVSLAPLLSFGDTASQEVVGRFREMLNLDRARRKEGAHGGAVVAFIAGESLNPTRDAIAGCAINVKDGATQS